MPRIVTKPDYAIQTTNDDTVSSKEWLSRLEKRRRAEGKGYKGRLTYSPDDRLMLYEAWAGGFPKNPAMPKFFESDHGVMEGPVL